MTDNHANSAEVKKYPKLVLNVWHGMSCGTFTRLVSENGCSCSWQRIDRLLSVWLATTQNSLLNTLDRLAYGPSVRRHKIVNAPVFIVGHWRTGTTLLHELLIRDPQFIYPNTYECLAPSHFLLTRRILPPLLRFLLPRQRPMDNMPIGWQRPQEDEFALVNQGVPSPYLFWMYPDRACRYDNYLELSGLTPEELQRWKDELLRFMKRITLRDPRAIVLKSPTHTARVKTLLELFPYAKFIHLARDPQVMIPSTILTWRRLSEVMGLKKSIREDLSEYVLDNFRRMDRNYQEQRSLIPPRQLFETRFEDLTADMIGTVQELYRHLDLGDFANIRPHLEEYAQSNKDYRRNQFAPDPQLARAIDEVCHDYARRYGYAVQPVPTA